ncbi:MAG: radical SAM protein, partial [Clostridia bacterium]|nr:radical SAM protein [Clostridia bacterium]
SWSEEARSLAETAETVSPERLVEFAVSAKKSGNIGIAFTYNEPLIGYEFVRDTSKLAVSAGLKTVAVTNGTAEKAVLEELGPFIDAMNIDLKGYSEQYYEKVLGGNLRQVTDFIESAVKTCHVELTTLIVPGENDGEKEMRELSGWVSGLKNPDGDGVPLHVSRFFPRFHMRDRAATDVNTIYRLADVAREKLKYVYTGNC